MPKKVDTTQRSIVEALRRCGVQVTPLHEVGRGVPDLLVSFRGRWFVVECKTGKDWTYTEPQYKFHREAHAPVLTFTSPHEAVTWCSTVRTKPMMVDDGDEHD